MAYTNSKKLTTAYQEEDSAASAVKNYGNFAISGTTNQFLTDKNNAYTAASNYGDFNASDALKATEQNKANTESAVKNYGDFAYGLQSSYDDVINKILNREKFSYDVNGDALYQQYKDQYVNQGKMAMMDTMGQAAAMTGGYGNSYAQSVGQQAYQGYLQQLTDKIPELYSLALDKYNSEGDEMYNQYSMLSNDRSTQYGEWSDGYNRKVADRDYYATDYYNKYAQEYGAYNDKYGRLVDQYNMASDAYNTGFNQDYTMWESGLNKLIDQRDYAGEYASKLYDQEYGEYSDKTAHDLALAQLAENKRQFDTNLQYDATGSAKLSNGKTVTKANTGSGAGTYTNTLWYDTGTVDEDGNKIFRNSDGKTQSFGAGVNPYTGTKNPDAKNGTFSNGYQPDNIGGEPLKKATKGGAVIYTNVTGKEQAVWKAGGRYYLWRGDLNRYVEVDLSEIM